MSTCSISVIPARPLPQITLLAFIFLMLTLSTKVWAQELPKGWGRPTKSEASDEWRNKSRSKFLVVIGDFDGDGKPDIAEILVDLSGKRWALFVKLQSSGNWQRVGDENEIEWLGGMGIALVKPGKYETACGKGYGEEFCAHGEPKYLKLSNDAIDLFKEESADSIAYWEQQAQKFRFVQMSD
jgi:hypothetical protein